MSTLGKVLTILIVLALLGWIFLAALVADHHINWSKRFAEVEKEVADLKASLPPLRSEIYDLTNEATVLQVGLDRLRRNYRGELAIKQREESQTKETLSRAEYQLKTLTLEVAAAERRHDVRRREVADFEANIKKEQAVVAEMIAENKALKDELAGLRKTFLATVAENKAFVERLRKPKTASAGPRTRLGSLAR